MKYGRYRVEDDCIIFDFYEFYFSSLRKNKVLTLDRIYQVNFHTIPVSMEIDQGEIIFFNHDDSERVKQFAKTYQIAESTSVDVWHLLADEFLDTEFSEDIVKNRQDKLKSLGLSEGDIQHVRKRIKWALFGTWEWQYLGHWDVLAMKQARNPFYRFNGSDFYWWTMKIAAMGKTSSEETSF